MATSLDNWQNMKSCCYQGLQKKILAPKAINANMIATLGIKIEIINSAKVGNLIY